MATKKAKKEAAPFKIEKRGDGRYQVRKRGGGFVNGADKLKILSEAGLVKLPKSAPKVEAAPAAE